MTKIHLDTDIGGDIDDLCALAMLLKWPDVEITGITTVADSNGKRAGYAKYTLGLADRGDIPLAAGADVSLGCYRFKPGYPKEEDYWPEPIPFSPNPLDNALNLLKNSIERGAIVIGIGPYTNLYLLDKKYPEILKQAKIYLMGGYIYPPRKGFPRWGRNMNYNMQVDVRSARYVVENSNPTLVPLSVTVETSLRRTYLPELRNSGKLGNLIARQAEAFAKDWKNEEKYGKTCEGLPNDTINFQHDPLACAIGLGWNRGVEIKELPLKLEIKNNWLYEHINDSGKPTKLVTKIDGNKFNRFWFNLLTKT